MVERFFERGYARFGADPALANWVAAAIGPARAAMADADLRARWLTCEGTWFVGVDALSNTAEGAIGGVALGGAAVEFAQSLFGALPLHRAQVSTVWPGYPRPREGEGAAAFGYRAKRDAAHVDGVRAEGAERVRRIDEPHGWILGIPLNAPGAGASPMVVWQGSHEIIRARLCAALEGVAARNWGTVDVTRAYKAARREVFETCRRVELVAGPGEAYLLHRLALHGVAPWSGAATGEGRMVAYFRPEMPGGVEAWLSAR